MKAVQVRDGAPVLVDRPLPSRAPGQARLAVRRAGICATDLEIVRGYTAHAGILGHEMVGEVIEHDDAAWIGRRVAVEINVGCGACSACARGEREHCARRTVMGIRDHDGCFAEQVVMPGHNLHPIPDSVDDDVAVFTEPLAAALRIGEQIAPGPDDRIAVVGDGKLGLLVALALAAQGHAPTVFGRHPDKLAIVAARGLPVADAEDRRARAFDVVVDATGSPAGLAAALDRVRPRGTLVLKSTFASTPQVDTNRIVVDEIRVLGSRCGPFAAAVAALASGAVDPRPLVVARYRLAEAEAALAHAARRGTLKVLVTPG